jgi:hypothetical protein
MEKITSDEFRKRILDLCVRSNLEFFPRKKKDRHILLKSIVLTFDSDRKYTEKEINEKLKKWIEKVNRCSRINHVVLRRALVDDGYLLRKADGSAYSLNISNEITDRFEPEVDKVDTFQVVSDARKDAEDRRKKHTGGN